MSLVGTKRQCARCKDMSGVGGKADLPVERPDFIRMTNEDVIDLVDRVKPGAIVVVLPPGRSAWLGPVAGSRS
jgi:hypothetical protein